MANQDVLLHAHWEIDELKIRKIGVSDLFDSLRQGFADFMAMPSHLMMMAAIYPVIGLLMGRVATGSALAQLVFPMLMGFALVGPLAATGLYELSRRHELGLPVSWATPFSLLRSDAIGGIVTLGALLMLVFFFWLLAAQGVYDWAFAYAPPPSITELVRQVFTTPAGMKLLIVGNGLGLLFAIMVLAIGAVSFPMIVDLKVSAATAMATSVKVMLANPATMAIWGLIVAASLIVGAIPLLLGLIVVLPVLGHATWHLYRKAIGH